QILGCIRPASRAAGARRGGEGCRSRSCCREGAYWTAFAGRVPRSPPGARCSAAPDGRVGSALVRGRDVAGRLLGVAAEQELLHLLLEEGAVLRVARRQPVLVDQHGLVRQPGGPCGLADVGVDTLAQLAGPGNEIQALGLALFVLAEDGAGHGRVASE